MTYPQVQEGVRQVTSFRVDKTFFVIPILRLSNVQEIHVIYVSSCLFSIAFKLKELKDIKNYLVYF